MRFPSLLNYLPRHAVPTPALIFGKVSQAVVICLLMVSVTACTVGQKSWSDLLTEGRTALKSGDPAKAETSYQAAIVAAQAKFGQNAPQTATCMTELADMYYQQQEYRKASKIFKDLIPVYEKVEPGSADLARVSAEYATVKKKLKKYKLEPEYAAETDTKTEQGKSEVKTDAKGDAKTETKGDAKSDATAGDASKTAGAKSEGKEAAAPGAKSDADVKAKVEGKTVVK